jgi:hypothetical protein
VKAWGCEVTVAQKLDLVKEFGPLYRPSAGNVTVVDVPRLSFFMIDGEGNPNTARSYLEAIEALYASSYTLKFIIKQGPQAIDYGVMPLEGLWWTGDGGQPDFMRKDAWQWTAMIMQPDFVTAEQAGEAVQQAQRRRNLPGLARIQFESFEEGLAAQMLYRGPYAAEQPAIERLHAFIRERGCRLRGKHHEIYLSDPRRTAPERLRTIIRQPFG